jgi:NAD(P)-dependent dehydrogenase (short-subunit alcohol dehydrogenase family)
VINVASISGSSPQLATSGQYGAGKAALIFDTERWALEFVPHGIRVNTTDASRCAERRSHCDPPARNGMPSAHDAGAVLYNGLRVVEDRGGTPGSS